MSETSIDTTQFMREFDAWVKRTGKARDQAIRAMCFQLFEGIVSLTPVDKGRLRNNWFLTIDKVSDEETDAKDKSGAKAKNRGATRIGRFDGDKHKAIYFTNNLPYAERIEYGYSKVKAPEGMVRVTLTRFERELMKAAKRFEI